MMISPDDHLHSRSIVDDSAADSGEKEPLRTEPFLESIRADQEKRNLDKISKKRKPLTKSSTLSRHAENNDNDNALLRHEGDNASTSSSSSSVSSAHSSACMMSTDEGIHKGQQPHDADKGAVSAGSNSAALHAQTKTLASGYTPVYEPRPADILLGRGKPFQSHPGNQFMLHAVDQLRDQYLGTDRKGKHNIIEHVLGVIKGRGGRFLMRIDENEENSPWMEVKRSISYRKVGHAFRSKARRAPATTTGSLNPPDWLMHKESGVPRTSSTGSSSRQGSQTSRRGADAETAPSLSKHDEDFIRSSPFLSTARGGQQLKIPSPQSKSRAQLKSGASTGVAPFLKGLDSRGTHSRITAVNPLLRLPDRLPTSSGLTRLVQEDEESRLQVDHAAIWALQQHQQQQQQQQHQLMALNNVAAFEQRLAAQHDAVLALRGREQQILNLLSHQQQVPGRGPGSLLQGTSSLPLLQAEAAALRFQSRLAPPLPTSAAAAYAFATASANQNQQRSTTSASSLMLSPLGSGAFATTGGRGGGGGAISNFLLDPSTTSAAELLIMEQQRRRELMQLDFVASQQRSWAGAMAAAAAAAHHQQHHPHQEAPRTTLAGGHQLLASLTTTTTSTNADAKMDAGTSTQSVKKRGGDSLEKEESAATMSPSSKKKRQRRGN